MKQSYQVDEKGFYGEFGGAYVPEILYATLKNLQEHYLPIIESQEFKDEYHALLRDYVGRPSPLYYANRMSERYGCQLYLKREDLNHTGAHKINNTIGQILLAKKMGKTRIIANEDAGCRGASCAYREHDAFGCLFRGYPRLVLSPFRHFLYRWLYDGSSPLPRPSGPYAECHL